MNNRKRWLSILFYFLATSLLTTPVGAQWKGDFIAGDSLNLHLLSDESINR